MGLLDSISGKVLGGGGSQGSMVNALFGFISNQSGGLGGLVKQFSDKGLGGIINSWVGTGSNLPISPDQVRQGLGDDNVSQLASKAGVPANEAPSILSKVLPQVVDKLTPGGKIPESGDLKSKGMGMLKGLMG